MTSCTGQDGMHGDKSLGTSLHAILEEALVSMRLPLAKRMSDLGKFQRAAYENVLIP